MDRKKLIAEIKQNFMLKRVHAQEECDNFIENLRKDNEFNNIYTEYSEKQIAYWRSKYEEDNLALKHDFEDLKAQVEKYLTTHGYDKSRLNPHYDCPICNDTGVVGGRICNCLLTELNEKMSKLCSSQSVFVNFADCDENVMNDTDKKVKRVLENWCDKFPNVSKNTITLIGGAGSGKTFMLECVADTMIKKNYLVCYKTAFELNELARLYHIGKSYDFADCLNAEILIIDDLGTEPVLKNVTKEYLYNIINTRQTKNLPTLISTNLSLDQLLDRYDDRIFSRLSNKNIALIMQLDSQDKRIRK